MCGYAPEEYHSMYVPHWFPTFRPYSTVEFLVLRTGNIWGCVPEEIGWSRFQGSGKGGVARAGFLSFVE
jgi:hypothetical protein